MITSANDLLRVRLCAARDCEDDAMNASDWCAFHAHQERRGAKTTSAPPPARMRDPLTARELQIVRLAACGDTTRQIADRGHVTEQTVKFHLANAFRKLGVHNRTAAVWRCLELGLIEPPARRDV